MYLSGFLEKTFYGKDYTVNREITVADLAFRVQKVMAKEMEVVRAQLARNHVDDRARPGEVHRSAHRRGRDRGGAGRPEERAHPDRLRHASRPQLDGAPRRRADLRLGSAPRRAKPSPADLIVVGAGVIGLEYASMVTALNIKVTVIEAQPTILDFVDTEMIEALMFFMRQRGATFRLGEKVVSVGYDEKKRVVATLESGKVVHGDALLYSVGRQTNADLLNLPAAGLSADERGRIAVNEHFQTAVPHIYAAGDVIGFPPWPRRPWSRDASRAATCSGPTARAATSRSRTASTRSRKSPWSAEPSRSSPGPRSPTRSASRGSRRRPRDRCWASRRASSSCSSTRRRRKLLGVHIFGERATEIVHIGQAVLAFGGTIEYFRDSVFNYPTMAEAYKVAGLDGSIASEAHRAGPMRSEGTARGIPTLRASRSSDSGTGTPRCCCCSSVRSRRRTARAACRQ